MRISHLLAALTVIAYAALQLGEQVYTMRLVWYGVIVTAIVWILEELFSNFPRLRAFQLRRHTTTQA